MGIWNYSANWVTTYYILTTMSNLVSSLLLLSIMFMMVLVNSKPAELEEGAKNSIGKREALDAPMSYKTKRDVNCVDSCNANHTGNVWKWRRCLSRCNSNH